MEGNNTEIGVELEKIFSLLLQSLEKHGKCDYHTRAKYSEFDEESADKWAEEDTARQELIKDIQDSSKTLRGLFAQINVQDSPNYDFYYLFQVLDIYFDQFEGDEHQLYSYSKIMEHFNYFDKINSLIERIDSIKKPALLSYFRRVIDLFLSMCPELDPFFYSLDDYPNNTWLQDITRALYVKLRVANIMAKNGENLEAMEIFYKAFNNYREIYPRFGLEEGFPILLPFLERSKLTDKLKGRVRGLFILSECNYLNGLYRTDPFEFFSKWADKDKLPLIMDVVNKITFPLNDRDRLWFKKIYQLFKPVCISSLTLDGLIKYIEIAEILIQKGDEYHGYTIYKWICQEIQEKLENCPEMPLSSNSEEFRQWFKETEKSKFHNELNQRVIGLLTQIDDIPEGFVKIFYKEPSYFESKCPEDLLDLFETIINKNPKLGETFVQGIVQENPKFKNHEPWQSIILDCIGMIPHGIIQTDLSIIFSSMDEELLDIYREKKLKNNQLKIYLLRKRLE